MRIILVLADAPLPFGRPSARWFHVLVRELTARGHRLTVFCPCADAAERERIDAALPRPTYDIRAFPIERRTGMRSRMEAFLRPGAYVFSQSMARDLHAELEKGFDALHVEQLESGWLTLPYRSKATLNVHNLLARDLKRLRGGSLKERTLRARLIASERALLRRYERITCLSDELRQEIKTMNPKARVDVVRLGIDASLYEYRDPRRDAEPVTIGLIGSFNWQPSRQAGLRLVEALWPTIREQLPHSRLLLVGREAKATFASQASDPSIEIHENVPDVIPFFRRLDLLLYPASDASGVKVKVQEAFALGIPVVTTPSGVEGMPVHDGVHVFLGNTDDELVRATTSLLGGGADLRVRVARNARSLVETEFSPTVTVQRVESLLHN